jgi:hypothetical protein
MKRTRIMGLCLVAVCAVFAFSATSAFATENLPHFGKCAKKAGGLYKNGGCTKLAKEAVEEHKFEWTTLGATLVKFTSKKLSTSGKAVLEGSSGSEITCDEQKQTIGEYGPGDQVKNVIGEFSTCQTSGFPCKSTGQNEGEIFTKKLHGEPGIIKKVLKTEKNEDGNDLRAETGTELAAFVCGPVSVKVTGGVVVAAKSEGKLKTNKMNNKVTVEFIAEVPGKQVPENWTPNGGGISNSKHEEINEHLFGDIGKGPEASGQSLITVQTTSPKTTKVELRQCEDNGKLAISCPN